MRAWGQKLNVFAFAQPEELANLFYNLSDMTPGPVSGTSKRRFASFTNIVLGEYFRSLDIS